LKHTANTGQHPAVPIADLGSLFTEFHARYPANQVGLNTCYHSKDLLTWACNLYVGRGPTYCNTPNSCINAGYVMFRLHSLTPPADASLRPAAAAANWTIITKFINGIDTPDPNTYRTLSFTDSSNGKRVDVNFYNVFSGGYKIRIDRTGRYLLCLESRLIVLDTARLSPTNPVGTAADFVFLNVGGHGSTGSANAYYQGTLDTGPGWRKWTFQDLTNDASQATNQGKYLAPEPQYPQSTYLSLNGAETSVAAYYGPPLNPPFVYGNEIVTIDTNTGAITRIAYVNGVAEPGFTANSIDLRQLAYSPDGKYVAYSTNYGNSTSYTSSVFGASYVMVAKVP
jgi:hypothetical protein